MPSPLTPTSSQEIVAISPPIRRSPIKRNLPRPDTDVNVNAKPKTLPLSSRRGGASTSKTISHMSNYASSSKPSSSALASSSTTLPRPRTFQPSSELKGKIEAHVRADKYLQQIGEVDTPGAPRSRSRGIDSEKMKDKDRAAGKRKMREEEVEKERKRLAGDNEGVDRERTTQRMMSTLGKGSNPITNSDLYTRTDHFVSSATGHQQSNAGGGSAGQGTYWEVRKAKMAEQARESTTSILSGCIFYLNGSTGPKVSNLQLQNVITSNGGRFVPMQSGSCTHIIANGGLSGTKTQKWIDGQGSRGSAKRMKVVTTDWILDSVNNGKRVSEAGYGVIKDPTQNSLLGAFAVKPKASAAPKEKDRQGSDTVAVDMTRESGSP